MKLSNRVYDILKWIARYLLPGLGTLYFALCSIWGFPYGEQVVGTITAVNTFLGVLLGISSATYNRRSAKVNGFRPVEPGDFGGIYLPGDPHAGGRKNTPHPCRRMEPNQAVPRL